MDPIERLQRMRHVAERERDNRWQRVLHGKHTATQSDAMDMLDDYETYERDDNVDHHKHTTEVTRMQPLLIVPRFVMISIVVVLVLLLLLK